jgi:hypothetical protein
MSTLLTPCVARAEQLNAGCQCVSLDRERLEAELERVSPGFHAEVMAGRDHLFADSVVFVGSAHLQRMAELVRAVEQVAALSAYQAHVLAWAPALAAHDPGTPGVFMGYDFHLGERGPQLIEINTNAGGGMLSAVLARANKACCADVSALLPGQLATDAHDRVYVDMFRREWTLWVKYRRIASADLRTDLRTLAITDDDPERQFLYPEFIMFQRMFRAAGIEAVICDPTELDYHDGRLWLGELAIDLVYNRLTDFSLSEPRHLPLREAYLDNAVLVTPHPRAHALLADKRNLVALTNGALLEQWGVPAATREVLLAMIPFTELVDATRPDDFWPRRRELFFKPAAGFGSRAAYRGDKMTRRVFDEVLAGDYIAQALVPPSQRTLSVAGAPVELKLDLRNYAYEGQVQLLVARLWQGQTTNFRTPGGGFAVVLEVPAMPGEAT